MPIGGATADNTGQHPRERLMALALSAMEGFRSLSLAADGGSAEDVGGASCWYSSSFVPVYNGAGLFSEQLFNRRTLSAIERYFARHERPYCLLTMDGLVPDADSRLSGLGYTEYAVMPAMWLSGPPRNLGLEVGQDDSLTITRVQTPNDIRAFRSVLTRVFFISPAEVELVLGEGTLRVPHVRHYLCRIGEVAAGTISLVLSGSVPGIWNVGTLPEYRRRGVGSNMMLHVLNEALSLGYGENMLLSSPDGMALYARLGYITAGTAHIYVPSRHSSG